MKRFLIAGVLWSACLSVSAQTPEQRGLEIARAADARDAGFGDVEAELTMVLRDQSGREATRQMRSQRLEVKDDGDKVLMTFLAPADIRDTALLSHTHSLRPDDQWLYLPAIKRVKRISSQKKSGPFAGSEFAFEDLSSQEVEKYRYRFLRNEPCGQWACYVVERFPEYEYSGYTRQVVWMDREHYRVVKIDFYDRRNALLKTLDVGGYKQYLDRFWRPDLMLMTNHQSKKSTSLSFNNYQFRTGLGDRDFVKDRLSSGRFR